MTRQPPWLEMERQEDVSSKRETCAVGERHRSQSPRRTVAVKAARGAESKAAPREGRIGRWKRSFTTKQSEAKHRSCRVSLHRRRGPQKNWSWVEASVWNERMLAALKTASKEEMVQPDRRDTEPSRSGNLSEGSGEQQSSGVTSKRQAVCGPSGDVSQGTERSAGTRTYRPMPVRPVEIAKGGGKQRPFGIPVIKADLPDGAEVCAGAHL